MSKTDVGVANNAPSIAEIQADPHKKYLTEGVAGDDVAKLEGLREQALKILQGKEYKVANANNTHDGADITRDDLLQGLLQQRGLYGKDQLGKEYTVDHKFGLGTILSAQEVINNEAFYAEGGNFRDRAQHPDYKATEIPASLTAEVEQPGIARRALNATGRAVVAAVTPRSADAAEGPGTAPVRRLQRDAEAAPVDGKTQAEAAPAPVPGVAGKTSNTEIGSLSAAVEVGKGIVKSPWEIAKGLGNLAYEHPYATAGVALAAATSPFWGPPAAAAASTVAAAAAAVPYLGAAVAYIPTAATVGLGALGVVSTANQAKGAISEISSAQTEDQTRQGYQRLGGSVVTGVLSAIPVARAYRAAKAVLGIEAAEVVAADAGAAAGAATTGSTGGTGGAGAAPVVNPIYTPEDLALWAAKDSTGPGRLSRLGSWIGSNARGAGTHVWNMGSGLYQGVRHLPSSIKSGVGNIASAAVSPNGRMLAAAAADEGRVDGKKSSATE